MSHRATSALGIESSERSSTRPTDRWILAHHDAWSRATLSPLFVALAHGTLHPDLFARWLLDRAAIAQSLIIACSRVKCMLKGHLDFPVLQVAVEEAEWLDKYIDQQNISVRVKYRPSYEAARLIELIDTATDDSGNPSPCVALTAPWCFLMTSWQACSLSRRNAAISTSGPCSTHSELRLFLSRDSALIRLIETQSILDSLLNVAGQPAEFSKAQKTFEEVLSRAVATLDQALEICQKDGKAPLCVKCGRKGHTGDRCTFKSHV